MLGFLIFFSSVRSLGAQPASLPITDFLLTPQSTLRAAEGELLTFIGTQPVPFTPLVWTISAPGVVEYSKDLEGCRYQVRVSQKSIGQATDTQPIGLLEVTAKNPSSAEITASFWTAWRHTPLGDADPEQTQGISLQISPATATEPVPPRTRWDPAWVWYFDHLAFKRQDRTLYYVVKPEVWGDEKWVRRPDTLYSPFTPESILGYRRFSVVLPPKGEASLQVYIPFRPSRLDIPAMLSASVIP